VLNQLVGTQTCNYLVFFSILNRNPQSLPSCNTTLTSLPLEELFNTPQGHTNVPKPTRNSPGRSPRSGPPQLSSPSAQHGLGATRWVHQRCVHFVIDGGEVLQQPKFGLCFLWIVDLFCPGRLRSGGPAT
jgi:hypothetical protein